MIRSLQNHRGITLLILIAIMVLLSACTTATPYQPINAGQRVSGGYSEQLLEPAHYSVAFAGNTLTSRERVEQYMLFRASELALRDGYDGFRIVDRTTECDRQTITERTSAYNRYYGYGWYRPRWRYYYDDSWSDWYRFYNDPFYGSRTITRVVERFEAHAEIELLRAPLDDRKYGVFDARRLVEDIGPGIEYPKG